MLLQYEKFHLVENDATNVGHTRSEKNSRSREEAFHPMLRHMLLVCNCGAHVHRPESPSSFGWRRVTFNLRLI
uniref:Uncharacterized protein n=1 Tax=Romanomermis culicivorax TaxID=13658 RepID=A0A915KI07_ROMCU